MVIARNKRSDIEIVAHMLSLAQKDTKKTHLMYQTNLCYRQLVYYMNFLLEKDFLENKNGNSGNCYCITDKGKEFLKSIEKVIVLAK